MLDRLLLFFRLAGHSQRLRIRRPHGHVLGSESDGTSTLSNAKLQRTTSSITDAASSNTRSRRVVKGEDSGIQRQESVSETVLKGRNPLKKLDLISKSKNQISKIDANKKKSHPIIKGVSIVEPETTSHKKNNNTVKTNYKINQLSPDHKQNSEKSTSLNNNRKLGKRNKKELISKLPVDLPFENKATENEISDQEDYFHTFNSNNNHFITDSENSSDDIEYSSSDSIDSKFEHIKDIEHSNEKMNNNNNNSDNSDHEGGNDAAADIAGRLFGANIASQLRSLMFQGNSQIMQMNEAFKVLKVADFDLRIHALEELSDILCMATSDMFSRLNTEFNVEELVKIIVETVDLPYSIETKMVACRCLLNLIEAYPRSCYYVVNTNGVSVFMKKMGDAEYIDLTEQLLSVLDKVSDKYASSLVDADGVSIIIQFIDFYNLHSQRRALTIMSKMCKNLGNYVVSASSVSTLHRLISFPDENIILQSANCLDMLIQHCKKMNNLENVANSEMCSSLVSLSLEAKLVDVKRHIINILSTFCDERKLQDELIKLNSFQIIDKTFGHNVTQAILETPSAIIIDILKFGNALVSESPSENTGNKMDTSGLTSHFELLIDIFLATVIPEVKQQSANIILKLVNNATEDVVEPHIKKLARFFNAAISKSDTEITALLIDFPSTLSDKLGSWEWARTYGVIDTLEQVQKWKSNGDKSSDFQDTQKELNQMEEDNVSENDDICKSPLDPIRSKSIAEIRKYSMSKNVNFSTDELERSNKMEEAIKRFKETKSITDLHLISKGIMRQNNGYFMVKYDLINVIWEFLNNATDNDLLNFIHVFFNGPNVTDNQNYFYEGAGLSLIENLHDVIHSKEEFGVYHLSGSPKQFLFQLRLAPFNDDLEAINVDISTISPFGTLDVVEEYLKLKIKAISDAPKNNKKKSSMKITFLDRGKDVDDDLDILDVSDDQMDIDKGKDTAKDKSKAKKSNIKNKKKSGSTNIVNTPSPKSKLRNRRKHQILESEDDKKDLSTNKSDVPKNNIFKSLIQENGSDEDDISSADSPVKDEINSDKGHDKIEPLDEELGDIYADDLYDDDDDDDDMFDDDDLDGYDDLDYDTNEGIHKIEKLLFGNSFSPFSRLRNRKESIEEYMFFTSLKKRSFKKKVKSDLIDDVTSPISNRQIGNSMENDSEEEENFVGSPVESYLRGIGNIDETNFKEKNYRIEFSIGNVVALYNEDFSIFKLIFEHLKRKLSDSSNNQSNESKEEFNFTDFLQIFTIKYKKVEVLPEEKLKENVFGIRVGDKINIVKESNRFGDENIYKSLEIIRRLCYIENDSQRLYKSLASRNSTKKSDLSNINLSLVPETAFLNPKISAKFLSQLYEPLFVGSNIFPGWLNEIACLYPFVIPFSIRHLLLIGTTFGHERYVTAAVNLSSKNSIESAQNRDSRTQSRGTKSLVRRKIKISRTDILNSMCAIMELYSTTKDLVEIQYQNEIGSGLGPTLEFYSTVSSEIRRTSGANFKNQNLIIWRPDTEVDTKNEKSEYLNPKNGIFPAPLKKSYIDSPNGVLILSLFKSLGKFVGKAMLDSRMIDIPFSSEFLDILINYNVSLDESTGEIGYIHRYSNRSLLLLDLIKMVDSQLYNSLSLLKKFIDAKQEFRGKEKDIDNISINDCKLEDLCLDFTLPGFPGVSISENIAVNETVSMNNIEEYYNELINLVAGKGIYYQIKAFKEGLDTVIPIKSLSMFSTNELLQLMCGDSDEDWRMDTLRDCIKPDHGYTTSSKALLDLYKIMSEFSLQERRDFLQFSTGSPRLPVGGFTNLDPPLTVVRKTAGDATDLELPSVMTCANYLKLPDYSDVDIMRQKLALAMKEGQGSFHLS